MAFLELISIVVEQYDPAIAFSVDVPGLHLEDGNRRDLLGDRIRP